MPAAFTHANRTSTTLRAGGFASLLHNGGHSTQLCDSTRQMSSDWTTAEAMKPASEGGYREPILQVHRAFYVPGQPGAGSEQNSA